MLSITTCNYDRNRRIWIGRSCRVGNIGKSITFFDAERDNAIAMDLIKVMAQVSSSCQFTYFGVLSLCFDFRLNKLCLIG